MGEEGVEVTIRMIQMIKIRINMNRKKNIIIPLVIKENQIKKIKIKNNHQNVGIDHQIHVNNLLINKNKKTNKKRRAHKNNKNRNNKKTKTINYHNNVEIEEEGNLV